MAKIVKTLTVSWQWSGDKYSLRGFNLAVTPTAKNPKEEVVATAFVETNEIKQTYSYKMGNVTLDKDAQYKIWVQAVYENSDSDWVSTGGATVTDDGSATIITKTDREIQDIVNMASDNILTRQEKISLRREWQEIVYEFLEIESTAISQGIPSSNTTFSNFKSKGNALGTYLNGGATWTISSSNKTSFPLWINDSNLASNTSINGNTYRETFRVYYEAKVKILEEINKYKVNNVQIGGINLLTGTKDFNVGKGSGTIHSENYKGFSVLHKDMSSATSGTSDVCVWSNAIDVKQNTEYTLSFYAKGSGSFSSYFYPNNVASGYSSEGKKTTASDGALTHTLTSNWKKYWITWKTSASTTGLKNVLPMRLLAGGVGYICGVKFEEGNKATDWSPSLEEMENAYTIVLTNEAQVIPTNSSRVPTTTATYYTDIQVYQGTVQRNDYTIGTVNSANGITVSKTSSRVNFAVSTNTALTVDGGNFTIPITIDGKTFNKTFSWSCSKQGNTGATGASGIGISSITEYYAVSSSNTTAPTSWSTTVPTMTATNKYLWNYETITYSNNTTTNTSKRVIGAFGDKGATGNTGATGNGISKIVNYYLATSSNSGVTTSTSGWTTTVQVVSASKKYLWNYEVVTYTNGSTSTTTPCIIGTYGDKGDKGDKGDSGDSAKNVTLTATNQVFKSTDGGITFTPDAITITPTYQNVSYSKWQYSTNGGSTWNDVTSSTNGVTYSSTSLTINETSTLFTSKITSLVFKIVTNNSSVHDTMTIVKLYDVTDLEIGTRNLLLGTAKGKTIDGNNGANQCTQLYSLYNSHQTGRDLNGKQVTISFDYIASEGATGTFRIQTNGNYSSPQTAGKWSALLKQAINVANAPSGTIVSTVNIEDNSTKGFNGIQVRMDNFVGSLTITKMILTLGNKQGDWALAPEELENAYTVILTNEAQVIPTDSSRKPTSSTSYYTDIQVYQGTTQRTDYTIGTINGANGITVSKTSSRVSFAVSTGTALTADGGNFTIPITIDNKTFNKTFSWSCSKQGNTGSAGNGINSITEYYAISSSNTTAPTSWSTTVPTMTATNKYLWNYEVIKYTDNTTKETSKRVIGAYGDKGATGNTGATGATGNGISQITNYYLATSSASGVTTSTSGWTTTVQSVSSSKKYLWNYEVVTYTNGSTNTTTPCIIGAYGDTGDSAKTVSLTSSSQVFKSTDGGVTFTPDNIVITPNFQNVSYSKWQYSTNGGSSWTDVSSSTNGITYSSTSLTLSKSSTLFTDKITSVIFKIITNNSSVTDTITIVKLYDVTDLQIGSVNRLAKTNKSVTMSTNQTGTGYNVFDPYKTPSNKYLKDLGFKVGDKLTIGFNWSISQNGANDLRYGNARAELCGKTSSSDYAYIVAFQPIPFATFSSTNTSGRFESTLTVTEAMLNVNGFRIRIDNSVLNLTISKVKLEKGNKATDWSLAPEELENAYSIILTNEAQVIPTTNSRVPTSSTTYYTDIQVYQGTTQRTDYTIGTINSANGITVSKTSSRVNFAVSTGTAITADGGNFIIPITIDGKTFNKTFSWSCSKQGNTGATGNAGQDAITIILSNENHTFPCESNGNIPTALSTSCTVTAYKGATSVTPTIGAITNPTGMTITKNGTTLTIQANTGTSLADSGTVNIPITVDGKTFNKTFTWSKAKKGATGATGATGAGAKTADIIASSQVFKSTDGGQTFSPTTITLTPKLQNVTYNGWQYSTNGGSTWSGFSNSISGWSVSNGVLTISKDSSLFTSTVTSVTFRLNTNDSSVYDTMTIVKLYDVTEINIGGRNLYRNTKVVNRSDWGNIGNWSTSETYNGFTVFARTMAWSGLYQDIQYEVGQTYTLSAYVRGANGAKLHFYLNGSGSVISTSFSGSDTLSDSWTRVWATFKVNGSDFNKPRFENPTDGATLKIYGFKLEKGNKPTDWTPAPEDLEDYADQSAQNAVNAQTQNSIFNKLTNNGQTQGIYLENSKIYINGEYIKANTLSADKVLVGDYTNYCQLTEQTPMSDKFNKYTHSDSTIWHEMKTLNRDTRVSRDYSCKGGEKFRVTGYVYGKVTSMTSNGGSTSQENTKFRVGIFGTKTDGSKFYFYGDDNTGSSTGSVVQFSKIVTLPSNAKSFHVVLHLDGWTPMSGVARCRNIEVRRMNTGELIVDGSIAANHITSRSITADRIKAGAITANEIAAGTITADKINANVLSASTIVSTINGGSTNISGNKIRTGTIQSNNGKSTINLDNGSMNLGATSDASYLQWTGSALNIKANSINIGTSSVTTTTDVTNKINDIKIGGTNLIKKKSGYTNGYLSSSNGSISNTGSLNNNQDFYTNDYFPLKTGESICFTSYPKPTVNSSIKAAVYIHVYNSSKVWQKAIYHDTNTANATANKIYTATENCYIRFCSRGFNDYNHMAEYSTKPSQWSPAPEDISTNIANAKNDAITSANNTLNSTIANYYTKAQTDSQINVAKDAITQSVSSTYETKTNVETKVNTALNSAKSYADTKKSEAISSAATDAANKVNSAKNELNTAINKKANSADVYKKTEVYTKNETNSQITTAKNEINQSVSSTYETKTNVTTKLNNLSVSATNLMDNSAPLSTSGWVNWSGTTNLANNLEVTTTDNSTHGKQGKITYSGSATGSAGPYKHPVQKLISGKSYSWSIWLRSGSGNLEVRVGQEQNGLRTVTVGTSWTRFTHTYAANDSSNYAFIIRPTSASSSSSLYFHSVMLVEGDKPVAWQTSPTEVLSDKTNIEQRMSSAESKITDTAITNTVKKNFYTKEETNNQITSKGYQTSSQVQQTVDNLQIKFTQSGGYNLFLNSGFKKNMSYWGTHTHNSPTGGSIGRLTSADQWGFPDSAVNCACIRLSNQSGIEYGISQVVKTTIGKKYTISFYYAGHRLNQANVIVRNSSGGSWLANKYISSFPSGGNSNVNNWSKCTLTFTANGTSHPVNIVINNAGNDGYMWIAKPQVVEGELDLPYSPNPNEVYDGLTTIDKDGIKVSTSKGAYTQFSSEGMNSYDNEGNMTLGLRNGGMTFHAYNNHEYVGYISQTAQASNGYNGVSLGLTPNGDYLSFGYAENATDPNKGFSQKSYMSIAPHSSNGNNKEGVNLYKNLYMHGWTIDQAQRVISDIFYSNGGIQLKGGSGIFFNADATYPSSIWQDASDGTLRIYGDNGMYFGYREGDTNAQCFYIKETRDGLGCRIGMYDHLNMNGWRIKNATVNNCSFRLDEYKRTTADYVSIFKASTSSKSEMNIELANDYVTWFNIQANNYVDGGRYIACFNYQNGTNASNVGVHFYRAMNCHGYNITNVGNMSVRAMSSEELEVNDIRIASPVSVARMNGKQTPTLSVVKSVDDVTEAHGVVIISNKKEKVELPYGLMFTGYYVQVTGNKVANLAVTEKTDEYFIIETDSEEEIEVFYTIKAFQPDYVTRTAIYGELQGEEGIATITYEEAVKAQGLSVQEQSLEATQPRTISAVETEGESFIIS